MKLEFCVPLDLSVLQLSFPRVTCYLWCNSLLRSRLSGCHATLSRKELSRKTAAKETNGAKKEPYIDEERSGSKEAFSLVQ